MSEKVRTWQHARKGEVRGVEVGGDDTWINIQLHDDHRLRYASKSNRGRVDYQGEVITLRRSLMAEVSA